jgi:hypothetical protein
LRQFTATQILEPVSVEHAFHAFMLARVSPAGPCKNAANLRESRAANFMPHSRLNFGAKWP